MSQYGISFQLRKTTFLLALLCCWLFPLSVLVLSALHLPKSMQQVPLIVGLQEGGVLRDHCISNPVIAFLLKGKSGGPAARAVSEVFEEVCLTSHPPLPASALAHLTNYYNASNQPHQHKGRDVVGDGSKMVSAFALLIGLHHLIVHLLHRQFCAFLWLRLHDHCAGLHKAVGRANPHLFLSVLFLLPPIEVGPALLLVLQGIEVREVVGLVVLLPVGRQLRPLPHLHAAVVRVPQLVLLKPALREVVRPTVPLPLALLCRFLCHLLLATATAINLAFHNELLLISAHHLRLLPREGTLPHAPLHSIRINNKITPHTTFLLPQLRQLYYYLCRCHNYPITLAQYPKSCMAALGNA